MARSMCGLCKGGVDTGRIIRFPEEEEVKGMRGQDSRKFNKVDNEIIKNYDNGIGEKDGKPGAKNLNETHGGTQESIDDCR